MRFGSSWMTHRRISNPLVVLMSRVNPSLDRGLSPVSLITPGTLGACDDAHPVKTATTNTVSEQGMRIIAEQIAQRGVGRRRRGISSYAAGVNPTNGRRELAV